MHSDALSQLLDIEQIKQLKARYCRYVDTKQWEHLRALFTPDARLEGLGSAPSGATVDIFINGISTRFKDAVSIHYCPTPEIRLTGADSARGVWSMMDYVQWTNGFSPREAPNARGFRGYGHYEEEYRRVGETWKIALLRLTRIRVDPIGANEAAPSQGLLAVSPDWLGIHGA